MCRKIYAAVKHRQSDDFCIIARTDAIAVEGFDAALQRASYYADAGADVLFVEAPESMEQIEKVAKLLPDIPKLINMFYGGKTPLVATDTLIEMGYKIIIIPSDLQRAAIKAMQKVLEAIRQQGSSQSLEQMLVSFQEREQIIGTEKYFDMALEK